MIKTPVPVAGTFFFWAGFVCSISFMEAWLKFQAPGVTLPVGLGIGKLVFMAMNRTEWVFVLLLMTGILPHFNRLTGKYKLISTTLVLILAVQTFFLLPELNQRAEMIISGNKPGKSPVHMLYGIAEVSKVVFLLYSGRYSMKLFSNKREKG